MSRSKLVFSFDIVLVLSALALAAVGITFIYSSGYAQTAGQPLNSEYFRQILWTVLGLVLLVTAALIRGDWIQNLSYYGFIAALVLVILTLLFGRVVNGSRSWLGILEFGIQPSEFAKLGYILAMARYLSDRPKGLGTIPGLIKPVLFFLLPAAILIALQPDVGTLLVFFPVTLVMFYFAGARRQHLGYVVLTVFLTGAFVILPLWEQHILKTDLPILAIFTETTPAILFGAFIAFCLTLSVIGHFVLKRRVFYWLMFALSSILIAFVLAEAAAFVMKDYQLMRLISFLDPSVDSRNTGWHIIQSTIAVGSGGFWGKGLLQGTQAQLQYLPEQSTDFIFSVISEEWGFVGALLVFALYGLVLYRMIRIGYLSKDMYSLYASVGIATMFFFHFIVNIGMTIGLMPITGIPLLMVSYGGSNMLMSLISIGIILNFGINRYK